MSADIKDIRRTAELSECGSYRYRLGRIMLEPMSDTRVGLAWHVPPRVMASLFQAMTKSGC